MKFRGLTWRVLFAAALTLLATSSLATARDLNLQIDPNSEAFGLGGWARRVADTGTIFYTCVEDSCGRGSTVSIRRQQGQPPNAETILRNEWRVSDTIKQRLQGRIDRIDIGQPAVASDGVFTTGEISRSIVAAVANPGVQLHWKNGFVHSPALYYSIVSSADTRALCDENYDMVKSALMLVGARR